ncbi:MAG: leucine-rich repeat protein, partial [Eubacteriales bacterium]
IRYNGDGGKVTIPNGITAIADGVFNENSNVLSVTISSSVKSIGNLSFAGCKNLTELVINSGVTQIKYGAFQDCSGLATVSIPKSVASIGQNAFNGTPWLQNYSGDFVVVGKNMLIKYKGSEKSVKIPKSVKSIGDYAFSDCKTIKRVAFPKKLRSIGDFAFAGCENLATMVIPNTVTSIGESAFYKCKSLTGTINIPKNVTAIGRNAFWDCTSIGSFCISNSVTNIGEFAFRGCTNLKSIGVGNKNVAYSSQDGVLFNKAKTTLIQYPNQKSGPYEIPEGVEIIETWAFFGCSHLKKITIPNSLKEIGWGTFENCLKLKEVSFPDSFQSIGDSAFLGCVKLKAINIPRSVAYIGDFAFKGCTKLAAINVDSSNLYYSSADGVLFNKGMTSIINYPCNKAGEYVIPNGVEHIDGFAFSASNGLTSVTIPSSVKSIGVEAFRACKTLERVFFFGNAPKMERAGEVLDFAQFDDCSPALKIYFISGNTGFPNLWYGYSTANFGVPVESVLLNTAGIKWPVGKSGTFKVTVTPDYATSKDLSWKSTNIKVATVDSNGKVTAVGAGTTTITCTAIGGNKTATCRMTVF